MWNITITGVKDLTLNAYILCEMIIKKLLSSIRSATHLKREGVMVTL